MNRVLSHCAEVRIEARGYDEYEVFVNDQHLLVLHDKARKGFVTGYLAKGQLHGIAKSITYAKPFQTKKSAQEFIRKILENIKSLIGKESYKQEILNYSGECFAICVNRGGL